MTKPILFSLCCLLALSSGCRKFRPPVSEIRMTETRHEKRLLRGFYEVNPKDGWRWTSRVFAVSLDPPPGVGAAYLELNCGLPQELMSEARTVMLIARVNGVEVGRQTYYSDGHYFFTRFVPAPLLARKPAEVEFELDRSVKDASTGRVLGLIAVAVGLKPYEATNEYSQVQIFLAKQGARKVEAQRQLQVPPAKATELQELFRDLPAWGSLTYQKVPIRKNPLDLWVMQQIIYEVRPDLIVETGTGEGGSALYWAHTLDGMGFSRSRVLTVDPRNPDLRATAHFLWKKYVEFLHGDATDPAILSAIAQKAQGRKTLVTIDSDYATEHVLRELRAYAPLVSRGSYLVVQNTHLDGVPGRLNWGSGPYEAVRRFLEEGGGKDFERDSSREAMVLTFNPGGWLRRK